MFPQLTPLSALGGVLIGLSGALLLLSHGRVAGISGILGGVLGPAPGDTGWRVAFLIGLVTTGALLGLLLPGSFLAAPRPLAQVAAAGLLVGFGTRLGNGCTSGHGVCGVSRGSPRSLMATVTFLGTGFLTVYIIRHLIGGG